MQHWAQVLNQLVSARVRVLLGVTLIAAGFVAGGSVGTVLTVLGILSLWTGTCGRCLLGSCAARRMP
jgi:ribosomal protein S5